MKEHDMTMRDAAIEFEGIEVHRFEWAEAAQLVLDEPGLFRLGSARGPNGDFKRLEYLGDC